MATEKQDPSSWRRRVDKKLNILWKGHEDLSARLDVYTKSMDTNTAITKDINKKVDALVESTASLVAFVQRARWTARVVKCLAVVVRTTVDWLGKLGVAVLMAVTMYWVLERTNGTSWSKAFINIFNGTLN